MELVSLKAAYSLCDSLYAVTPDDNTFEDLALEAWSRIGTKHTRLYSYVGSVEDKSLQLPCNVDVIESVHVPIPDSQMTSNISDHPWQNLWVEGYIDRRVHHSDPYFSYGKLVRYDEGNNELYFSHNYSTVKVVYHGIIADDDTGLPLVNDKELRAVAAFVAYASIYREGIKKKDANILKLAQTIKEDWLRACNAARIPEHFSQNDMDAILDVKTSWNRKSYGKSFHAIV